MIPFVDLKAQYRGIREEVGEAIGRVLEGTQFILGEEVEAFESEFAAYCGARHAVGVNSGTSALHLALLAAGVGPGDEVVTVSHTFVATAAAVRYCGAAPVFVDIDPRTCLMDPERVEAAITPKTKAIMPVHLYGQCADMDAVNDIARRRDLPVIEDAAQAHGAEYEGRRAGGLAPLACFSFYPGKNLGAYGEGGAVTTDSDEHARLIRELRDHGQSRKYHHDRLGYNYRLEGMQGAVLRVKLRHLDEWNAARRAHAAEYRRLLAGAPVRLLEAPAYESTPVHHIFPVFTPRRDALAEHLKAAGVSTGIHYPVPVHLQQAFAGAGRAAGDLSETERAARETLSLPMYAELPADAPARVAEAVFSFDAEAATATRA
ncbi:MAG TPA: DegT/DnrJ/EryC1/StrS family aminotransferase [Pyrinomonadaceae bacterium]|nr:DegT/DnrJ/EryC1/StrS family aminotransferase [Pyrinomonadaceae bacterium]